MQIGVVPKLPIQKNRHRNGALHSRRPVLHQLLAQHICKAVTQRHGMRFFVPEKALLKITFPAVFFSGKDIKTLLSPKPAGRALNAHPHFLLQLQPALKPMQRAQSLKLPSVL